jgi:DNA-3-methyladenine glycosylase II
LRFDEGMPMTPDYWQDACDALTGRCDIMKNLIATHPVANLRTRGNPFQTLARAIVGQQISVKAAQSVWSRTVAVLGVVAPETIVAAAEADLRGAGLSRQKIAYLKDLAAHFLDARIRPRRWRNVADQQIIDELVAVKGIGRWTAEMFLIFYLMRPNVWPVDDIGLVRAIEKHYHGGELQAKKAIQEYRARFEPWATVATWYLWRSLEPEPVVY